MLREAASADDARRALVERAFDIFENAARASTYRADLQHKGEHLFVAESLRGGILEFRASFLTTRWLGSRRGEGKDPLFSLSIRDRNDGSRVLELMLSNDQDALRAARLYRMLFDRSMHEMSGSRAAATDPLVRAAQLV